MPEEEKPTEGEEAVLCPVNLRWLREVYAWMPPKIWKRSRLADLEACIRQARKK